MDTHSRTRPKPLTLSFLVKWAPPYQDPSHDSWEPMHNLKKLDAFRHFLSSPAWYTFASTPAYLAFAAKYKTKVPH
jgi:hypothetical protein